MRTRTEKEKIENYDKMANELNLYRFATICLAREVPHKVLKTEEDDFEVTVRLYGLDNPEYDGIVVITHKSIRYDQAEYVNVLPLDKFYRQYWNDNNRLIRDRSCRMAQIAIECKYCREKYFEKDHR